MEKSDSKGFLSIEVKAPPIIAGMPSTISLIIRNPFSEPVIIESIQAPSSAPLLPKTTILKERQKEAFDADQQGSSWGRFFSSLNSFLIKEIHLGPLVAEFPHQSGRTINVKMEPNSKLTFKAPLGPDDTVNISNAEKAEVIFDVPDQSFTKTISDDREERVISPQQEDLASFELQTAHWLLVKPKVLELHALIRYRISSETRSQVVPVSLSIQPPVKAIILGTVSGGVLGYLARQLNAGISIEAISIASSIVSLLGIIVMATILAIVLSRQESSKGFVTLEDFYGAFVAGALLGYTGTEYFNHVLDSANGK